ncbi:MAG: flavodoxin family protein [Sedimentibacter sp.]
MSEKWIAIVGSQRKGKNTDLLVDYIIQVLNEKNIMVDKFILDSNNITTCSGCECCIRTGKCIVHDDITKIIEEMKVADGYIFASPSYNYNVTAQMKALLDRTFCLNDYSNGWKSRLSPYKKAIVVGVCKGKAKEAMGYTVECMSKSLSELGVKIIDTIEYYDTKNLPVANNDRIEDNLFKIINLYEEISNI